MQQMSHRQRVQAALHGKPVDRPPLCFWHHFKPQGKPDLMAELTINFFKNRFDLDIIKIMPDLEYPEPENPIKTTKHLSELPKLTINTPAFQKQLQCIQMIRSKAGADFPLILTLFSPLSYTMRFMGKKEAVIQARSDPSAFKKGLSILTENLRILIMAAMSGGADGIFFASMGATTAHFTESEYKEYGVTYDLKTLAACEKSWLNISHIHADPTQINDTIYFRLFTDYPVSVISWDDKLTGPRLKDAKLLTAKCLMSGISDRGPIVNGDKKSIEEEMHQAILEMKGDTRLILAPGCSLPDTVSEPSLTIARQFLDTI